MFCRGQEPSLSGLIFLARKTSLLAVQLRPVHPGMVTRTPTLPWKRKVPGFGVFAPNAKQKRITARLPPQCLLLTQTSPRRIGAGINTSAGRPPGLLVILLDLRIGLGRIIAYRLRSRRHPYTANGRPLRLPSIDKITVGRFTACLSRRRPEVILVAGTLALPGRIVACTSRRRLNGVDVSLPGGIAAFLKRRLLFGANVRPRRLRPGKRLRIVLPNGPFLKPLLVQLDHQFELSTTPGLARKTAGRFP